MHNVAVGHKNAIKSLFGFGVTCKIDSSVWKKTNKQSMWYAQCQIRHITFLPATKKQLSLQRGLHMIASIYKDTVGLCVFGGFCFLFFSLHDSANIWLDTHRAEIFYFYTKSEIGGNMVTFLPTAHIFHTFVLRCNCISSTLCFNHLTLEMKEFHTPLIPT